MNQEIKYRGKIITTKDIEFINNLIITNPEDSRWRLSKKLCTAWNWVQANGKTRDMVCRGLMLFLHRSGYIKLPEKKSFPPNPFLDRKSPKKIKIDETMLISDVKTIKPLEVKQVRRTKYEKLFNSIIETYHYLGYCHPVGEQLKYIFFKNGRPIACFAWSSAARHIGNRDRYIGWPPETRKRNLKYIAYNSRFLILPHIKIKFLASHLLSLMIKRLASDWLDLYHHPIYFLETFVDTEKFKGTSYHANGWRYIGLTTGRGKNDRAHKVNRSLKAIWCYPLCYNFREVMCL